MDATGLYTSRTLLLRLRDLEDDQAWSEFVQRYAPKIFAWCQRYGLQDSDAADVSQMVMEKLVKSLRNFDYDPSKGSFRGWLKTVTNNAVRDFGRSIKPDRGSGDTHVHMHIQSIQDPAALQSLAATLEDETEWELLREAEARVSLRVTQPTWSVYELTVKDAVKPQEVARQIDMPIADVYRSKSRVIRMIHEEVDKLQTAPEQNPEA